MKEIGLQLCTCTWIEIMTGAGLTLYIVLAMHNYGLAALTAGLFAPLIGFHFVITLISKRDDLVGLSGIRGSDRNQASEKGMPRSGKAITQSKVAKSD